MITIVLCTSMYIGVDKGPNKYGLRPDLAQGPPFEKASTRFINLHYFWEWNETNQMHAYWNVMRSIPKSHKHQTSATCHISQAFVQGALDKYNVYLFISNSIDFKSNQYRNFQLILPMRFHFMVYFVNSIIYRVSHRLLYCVFIEVDFEK